MRAAITTSYGPASVLRVGDVPEPAIGDRDVLVQVHASPVTAADHRLRSADFPSFTAVIGRLMLGVFGPRRVVQGTSFSGRVVAVGRAVTRFAVGDEVFGGTDHGAYAEYLVARDDGPIAKKPSRLRHDEAAAIPYGAPTALHFLRDLGRVRRGDRVLILGASGGVGRFAVQVAKHLGAEVTAACSSANAELVRGLGADHVLDYATTDFTKSAARYEVIFDVAGVTTFGRAQAALTHDGRYLTLLISVAILVQMLFTARAKFAIVFGNAKLIEEVGDLAERGVLRPVIAKTLPLDRIAEAHAARERGAVIVAVR